MNYEVLKGTHHKSFLPLIRVLFSGQDRGIEIIGVDSDLEEEEGKKGRKEGSIQLCY